MVGKSILDINRLKENAILSIQLGIEDFEVCQKKIEDGGKPARALSAIRNLFSGVLLLFKYRITLFVPDDKHEQREQLIYNPPREILPYLGDDGDVEWRPTGKFRTTTIDVHNIQSRFETLKIRTDWKVIEKLQQCRNHLEHLHPINSLGEIADFVAELFPILRDFIQNELEEDPRELLQDSWNIMLKQHDFFESIRKQCLEKWQIKEDIPEKVFDLLEGCQCESCGSILLSPSEQHTFIKEDANSLYYCCLKCGCENMLKPLLEKQLNEIFFQDYKELLYNPPSVTHCFSCGNDFFVREEDVCFWCDEGRQYEECEGCGESLDVDEQDNGGMCSRCSYRYSKIMDE